MNNIDTREHFNINWGWVKFQDGTFHKIEIFQDGVIIDGVIIAKGKLSIIKAENESEVISK